MDLHIFQFINGFAGKWEWLDQLGIFLASGTGYVLTVVVLALFFLRKKHRRMAVVSLLSAAMSKYVLVALIRMLYHRPRPVPVDVIHQLVVNEKWAFPSGHAAFFFALATGVFLYNKKLGTVFYAFAALMGISRIFIGVHWPTDILVGAALGMLTALGVDMILRKRFPSLQ